MSFTPSTIRYIPFATASTPLSHDAPPSPHDSDAGVAATIPNDKSATYTEVQPGKVLPTVDEVNERVNQYRASIAKAGRYVDINGICKHLCDYYGVKSVQELRCSDRMQGFSNETDIPAINDFSKITKRVIRYLF